jgi:hypothetical protein
MRGWKRAAPIVGGVMLGVVLLCGGGLAIFIHMVRSAIEGPQNVEISIACPEEVRTGEEFEIVVTVRNTGAEAQSIAGFDVSDAFLEGVDLTGSDPPWDRTDSIFDFTSYYYDVDLPPGQAASVRLKALAGEPGFHSGGIDVCINNDFTYESLDLNTLVRPEGQAESEAGPEPGAIPPGERAAPGSAPEPADPDAPAPGRKPLPRGRDR